MSGFSFEDYFFKMIEEDTEMKKVASNHAKKDASNEEIPTISSLSFVGESVDYDFLFGEGHSVGSEVHILDKVSDVQKIAEKKPVQPTQKVAVKKTVKKIVKAYPKQVTVADLFGPPKNSFASVIPENTRDPFARELLKMEKEASFHSGEETSFAPNDPHAEVDDYAIERLIATTEWTGGPPPGFDINDGNLFSKGGSRAANYDSNRPPATGRPYNPDPERLKAKESSALRSGNSLPMDAGDVVDKYASDNRWEGLDPDNIFVNKGDLLYKDNLGSGGVKISYGSPTHLSQTKTASSTRPQIGTVAITQSVAPSTPSKPAPSINRFAKIK